ncbi:MAG TPA: hypothetical protein VM940_16975 [Chthoniobacterales bacterium]|jgi:hypothetical protein|nr:hypothetical protein [Chthoniobacterales bacterium]
MKELGDALRSILDKLSQFLDLFDLSFLLSGAATGSAICYLAHRSGIPFPIPSAGWQQVAAVVVFSYVSGLASFALGRWPRTVGKRREKSFDALFLVVLGAHGLSDVPSFKAYLDQVAVRGSWRLYVRLWAEIRVLTSAAPTLALLNRYWVMAAMYDGLFVAAILWIGAIASGTFWLRHDFDYVTGTGVCVALLLVAWGSYREAGRYFHYQIEELVAAVATARQKHSLLAL